MPLKIAPAFVDLIRHHALRDGLDRIDDIIDFRNQSMNVLTIDRRDVSLLQPVERFVRNLVAFVFRFADGDQQFFSSAPARFGILFQHFGGPQRVLGSLFEAIKKLEISR